MANRVTNVEWIGLSVSRTLRRGERGRLRGLRLDIGLEGDLVEHDGVHVVRCLGAAVLLQVVPAAHCVALAQCEGDLLGVSALVAVEPREGLGLGVCLGVVRIEPELAVERDLGERCVADAFRFVLDRLDRLVFESLVRLFDFEREWPRSSLELARDARVRATSRPRRRPQADYWLVESRELHVQLRDLVLVLGDLAAERVVDRARRLALRPEAGQIEDEASLLEALDVLPQDADALASARRRGAEARELVRRGEHEILRSGLHWDVSLCDVERARRVRERDRNDGSVNEIGNGKKLA